MVLENYDSIKFEVFFTRSFVFLVILPGLFLPGRSAGPGAMALLVPTCDEALFEYLQMCLIRPTHIKLMN